MHYHNKRLARFSGLEVFYQVAGQIILLIYAKTETRTTRGLETVFDQDTFMGLQFDPVVVLCISIAMTLRSCFTLHLKTIKTEKHFVPIMTSILILFWGFFSSVRRILSLVCWFIPSLGLFSILFHYKAEQIPFKIWRKFNRTQSDKIVLLGLEAKRILYWQQADNCHIYVFLKMNCDLIYSQ